MPRFYRNTPGADLSYIGEDDEIQDMRRDTIEQCAKVAESYPARQNPDGEYVPTAAVSMCWREIAGAIRAIIASLEKKP